MLSADSLTRHYTILDMIVQIVFVVALYLLLLLQLNSIVFVCAFSGIFDH